MALTSSADLAASRVAPHPVRLSRAAAEGTAAGTVTRGLGGPLLAANRVGQHVRVPKTAELVAAHLRRQIVRGELHEG
ncbi:GntR family transcriptional regulator, partial [Frankia sp. AiPa1]|nr:GntR family transcriptional regulator [Frankia sp. AiPa1]